MKNIADLDQSVVYFQDPKLGLIAKKYLEKLKSNSLTTINFEIDVKKNQFSAKVVDKKGIPIPKAYWSDKKIHFLTSVTGQFNIDPSHIRSNKPALVFAHGYQPREINNPMEFFSNKEGTKKPAIQLQKSDISVIKGQLLDSNNKPLSNYSVHLLDATAINKNINPWHLGVNLSLGNYLEYLSMDLTELNRTDQNGEFKFSGLIQNRSYKLVFFKSNPLHIFTSGDLLPNKINNLILAPSIPESHVFKGQVLDSLGQPIAHSQIIIALNQDEKKEIRDSLHRPNWNSFQITRENLESPALSHPILL